LLDEEFSTEVKSEKSEDDKSPKGNPGIVGGKQAWEARLNIEDSDSDVEGDLGPEEDFFAGYKQALQSSSHNVPLAKKDSDYEEDDTFLEKMMETFGQEMAHIEREASRGGNPNTKNSDLEANRSSDSFPGQNNPGMGPPKFYADDYMGPAQRGEHSSIGDPNWQLFMRTKMQQGEQNYQPSQQPPLQNQNYQPSQQPPLQNQNYQPSQQQQQ
jgi:hypothetical protein